MSCPHDFVERETAVTADGYCPLCLAALKAELVELLKKHHTWHRSRPDNGYTDSALYNATDAAIAKAKGGVE